MPDVKIIYEPQEGDYLKAILNSLSAGTAADIFYMDIYWAKNIMNTGTVEPLDSYIAKSTILKKEDLFQNLIEAFTYDGKLYGIPKDFNTLALFYNKEIFDEGKVPYPNDNDTWQTLETKFSSLAKAVTDVTPIALAPQFERMGAFAFAAGFVPIVSGKTNLNSPEFLSAFNWYVGLCNKRLGVMPADVGEGWGGGAFANEKTAACIEGAWILSFLKDKSPNLDYGSCLLPKDPVTNERGNFIYSVAWGMNSKSKVKSDAFKVIEILTSPEAQKYVLEKGLAIPSRMEFLNSPYFKQKDKIAEANYTVLRGLTNGNVRPYYFGKYGGEWMNPINSALNEVMGGQSDASTALKEAQANLNNIMKQEAK